jgi:NTE family protein
MRKPVVALALGGGSARGLAHIGVIKVLEENDIPIDLITGTSMGAIVGGFYCYTKNIAEIEKIALSISNRKMFNLLDPSFKYGFFGGKKIMNFLEEHLGHVDFKDLKIPLVVVATDINSGKAFYFEKGDLTDAIRASISIPLVFSPLNYKGKFLVDGHLSEPVPVNAALSKKPDVLIAVNLDSFQNMSSLAVPSISLSGIARKTARILLYQLSQSNSEKADVVISPDIEFTRFASFSEAKDLIRKGELAAIKALPEIKKLMKSYDSSALRKVKKINKKLVIKEI